MRSKSSSWWLNEHAHDAFVQLAKKEGYRSRAAYKLLEIDQKDNLLKPGMLVVDLGSAPGSWSQVVRKKVKQYGKVFALDILSMEPIEGVSFLQGDFTELEILRQLEDKLRDQKIDLVICDMAPNMTGTAVTDQAKSYFLAELAADFAKNYLRSDGRFLVKVFQGSGYNDYVKLLKSQFMQVVIRKPQASRNRSNELYLLASVLRQ
jgi:ftsJ-like methyltransferase